MGYFHQFHSTILFVTESFVDDGDDTMESVLSWKLTEISQAKAKVSTKYNGPGKAVVNEIILCILF